MPDRRKWPDGHLKPTKVERLSDGTQRILEYVGDDRQLRDAGKEEQWEPLMELAGGEVLGEWVKCSDAISVAPLYETKGDQTTPVIGVVADFGVVRVAVPVAEWRAALKRLAEIVG